MLVCCPLVSVPGWWSRVVTVVVVLWHMKHLNQSPPAGEGLGLPLNPFGEVELAISGLILAHNFICLCAVFGAWGEMPSPPRLGAGGSNSIYNHILAVTDFLICRKGLLMCHSQADGFQVVVAVHNLRRQQYRQALRRSQQQVNECCCCHCHCSDDVSQR
jgi:hypothetical protein